MPDSQLIESLEDCFRREKRRFRWIWIWLGAFVGCVVLWVAVWIAFAHLFKLRMRAGQDAFTLVLVCRTILNTLMVAALVSLVAFPSAIFSWVGAIRRRQFSYSVLHDSQR